MGSLIEKLNEVVVFFSFKVLYVCDYYDCYDVGVFYFDKDNYELVRQVLLDVYGENKFYFKLEIFLFIMELVLGLGLVEELDRKFVSQESFGMNRCQMIVNGLLKVWDQGDNLIEGRMRVILE